MGASIFVDWPGATEEEQSGHPGFQNDDDPYASWIEACGEQPRLLRSLGVEALLASCDYEEEPTGDAYTTPDALSDAAQALIDILEHEPKRARKLLELYEEEEIGGDDPEVELAQDLADVIAIADYVRKRGAKKLVLKIGW